MAAEAAPAPLRFAEEAEALEIYIKESDGITVGIKARRVKAMGSAVQDQKSEDE